jgi:16S rRNA (uracil1498-N3)-methyltransferase
MPTPRIYIPTALEINTTITLAEKASHHLLHVLRLKKGAIITLFNDTQYEYWVEIVEIEKNKTACVQIIRAQLAKTESPLHIHLGQGISRGERMDYAVQKSVELGVAEITPLITERCEVRLTKDRMQRRVEHWQQIAIHACEQSGRCRVPVIHPAATLEEWASKANGFKLVCSPIESAPHFPGEKIKEVSLLIGAEGGLSEAEIKAAKQQDFQGFSLGPRILRTETAPVVALTLLQHQWGDLN